MESVTKVQRQCDLYTVLCCCFFLPSCTGTLNTGSTDTEPATNTAGLTGKCHMEQNREFLRENYKELQKAKDIIFV